MFVNGNATTVPLSSSSQPLPPSWWHLVSLESPVPLLPSRLLPGQPGGGGAEHMAVGSHPHALSPSHSSVALSWASIPLPWLLTRIFDNISPVLFLKLQLF